MYKLLAHLRKEFLGVVVVTIAIVFFSAKRSAFADTTQEIENLSTLYTTISEQIQPLADTTLAGDELMNEKISDRRTTLQQTKEQLPVGVFSDKISHLQANLAILQNDIPWARALLPRDTSQESYFNHGSLELLEAYTYWKSDNNKEALLSAQSSLSDYNKALEMPLGEIPPEQLQKSFAQAQRLYFLIALTSIFDTHQQLIDLSKATMAVHETVVQKIISVKGSLLKWQFWSDVSLNACKQDLTDALSDHQDQLNGLPRMYQKLQLRSDLAIRTCLENPLLCVQDSSFQNDWLLEWRVQLQQLLESWLLSYQRLETIITRRDTGALRALCTSSQQSEQTNMLEEILNQMQEAAEPAESVEQGEEGTPTTVDLDADDRKSWLPIERDSEVLEQIDARAQEWLQKTSDLERDPAYSPEEHLQNLFEEFWWDTTWF